MSPRSAIQERPLEVVVTVPELAYLEVSLAGNVDVFFEGDPTEELTVKLTGAGKLLLDGLGGVFQGISGDLLPHR